MVSSSSVSGIGPAPVSVSSTGPAPVSVSSTGPVSAAAALGQQSLPPAAARAAASRCTECQRYWSVPVPVVLVSASASGTGQCQCQRYRPLEHPLMVPWLGLRDVTDDGAQRHSLSMAIGPGSAPGEARAHEISHLPFSAHVTAVSSNS